MNRYLGLVIDSVRESYKCPYFGFVNGHSDLTVEELSSLESLVAVDASEIVTEFECAFSSIVGDGESISYAAARMGFYELMRVLGVGKGDEVILLGATCAVMVNAVTRTGATPVYSDVDPDTFGSTATTILKCISDNTVMIVAQHSFGIPCDIKPIVDLAKSKDIFLLEDCALTLGSKLNGTVVGNFGGAALFSTDHSKPINTLTGGLIYTCDSELAHKLRESQANCLALSHNKQSAIWSRILQERQYCNPKYYGRLRVIDLVKKIFTKIIHQPTPFLDEDFGVGANTTYPYPAKMPPFLAALGLIEIKKWPVVASNRKTLLKSLIDVFDGSRISANLPKAYKNKQLEIIPLRLAWFQPDGLIFRESIAKFVDITWTWFMRPIIATPLPLESLGYHNGACPVSERIGTNMVNLPCNISREDFKKLISLFQESVS